MTIALSDSNWDEYWQPQYESIVTSFGKKEEIWREKGSLGQSLEQCIPLRHGLSLEISDYQMDENVVFHSYYQEKNYLDEIFINFVVSGNVKTIHHGITDYVWETAGTNYIEFWDSRKETEYWQKGDRILKIRVGIELDNLKAMICNAEESLPSELKSLVEGKDILCCYRQGNNTIAMQNVLTQILKCPYQGCTRNFYLESKALELFALWLGENSNRKGFIAGLSLNKKDIEALKQVKEIMQSKMQNPPTINDLSRQLCLNEFKLKKGFKQLFGQTIFSYLHQQRMEYAKYLLRENNLKVSEVADSIGYSSLPSFSKAFQKYCGVSPRSYRNLD